MRRLVAYAFAVSALTMGGAGWAIWRSDVGLTDLAPLMAFGLSKTTLLVVACLAVYATDVIRYRVLGRAIDVRVPWRTALDASVANLFFAWVTPGTAFGAPAAMYMLGRGGVSLEAAALIAVGKSLLGVAVLLVLAFLCFASGLAPDFGGVTAWLLLPGTALVAGLLILWVLASVFDRRAIALLRRALGTGEGGDAGRRAGWAGRVGDSLVAAVEQLARLRQQGAIAFTTIFFSHMAYFASFIGVAVVVAMGLGAQPLSANIGTSTVYLAFSYVAPTPGGAGLSEAAATTFYGHLLRPDRAVLSVLLFRGLTFYLQVIFGFAYLTAMGAIGAVVRAASARARTGKAR